MPPRRATRSLTLFALIIAGEAIFFLPFVIARVFRPTMLEVFGISNLELGFALSAYGVVAMLAYFPGGPLADLFSPRKLMATALLATAAGGWLMASIPDLYSMRWLYAYWGLTTILLFWAALIRATRQLGGDDLSGTAFGVLDGGRGLMAAVSGSIAVMIFASLLPVDVESATHVERADAFGRVILIFTGITFAAALLVWIAVPDNQPIHAVATADQEVDKLGGPARDLAGVAAVLCMPVLWLQAVMIVCAYVAYKGLDDLSLYAKEVLQFDEVSAAYTSTVSMWIRPVAAVVAGLIADRTRVSLMMSISFAMLAIGCGVIASDFLRPGMTTAFFAAMIATSVAVFALRSLYFALMQEGHVPYRYTGTAVGFVSAVGYTPDVFMGPWMGKLLDDSPGVLGHQHVFGVITGFAVTGFVASFIFQRITPTR